MRQARLAQQSLGTHDMHDEHALPFVAVEDAARRFDKLTIARAAKFRDADAALWMLGQLLHMREDALHEFRCGGWVLQRDVVGDGFEVGQCRLRPDYFSHRASRTLA